MSVAKKWMMWGCGMMCKCGDFRLEQNYVDRGEGDGEDGDCEGDGDVLPVRYLKMVLCC